MSTPKPAGGYHSGGFIPPASTTIHVPPKFTPTPTPIDPADIRPGDVVEWRLTYSVIGRGPYGAIEAELDGRREALNPAVGTWHLVHRPDPDAEAIEALATRLYANPADQADREEAAKVLQALRDGGWDVVRRAEP